MNTTSTQINIHQPCKTATEAVATLTQSQLDRLLAIAARRLERLNQSSSVQRLLAQSEPADFVHDAIMLVLAGDLPSGQGRHTRSRHLASHQAFFNFLQGIIQSRISAHLQRLLREGEHCQEQDLTTGRTVIQDVQLNEVKSQLSARLREVADNHPALLSTLAFLELDTPQTDCQPTRKQLHKMRKAGRQALQEIAEGHNIKELFMS